jgi:pyrroline-5-carboxylate reductase
MKISFVGGGVMAEAILRGILDAEIAASEDIRIGEPVESRREYLEGKYGTACHDKNMAALDGADIIVLSVKPQNLSDVMAELAGSLDAGQTVVSIIAGARLSTLSVGLKHDSVIRVMPNTPSQIGAGMSVWTASSGVPESVIEATRRILGPLGEEVYVEDEKFIDMATALSASGPAYVFLFIEALIDAGVYLGMPRDMASRLALQTVAGSTQLVRESGRHPAELKDMVTSPGGTTAEALLTLEQGAFKGVIIEAVAAAYEKSKALGG